MDQNMGCRANLIGAIEVVGENEGRSFPLFFFFLSFFLVFVLYYRGGLCGGWCSRARYELNE